MASTSAVSMSMPLIRASQKTELSSNSSFFKPLPVRQSKVAKATKSVGKFEVQASLKEKAITGLAAAALTASMIVPDVAEAASGVSPSLNNFLYSIAAGGVVATVIVGAVIGVSNFDPVKRS
ncbi:hypothetical protein ACJIZ3_018825 [Penstemon smallii]|uniref:Ultraviolet-B-repressible protein n=1 Tax=Penstemon smallii TaxID=265156 RepID=A0ABD3T0N5_9LAMI